MAKNILVGVNNIAKKPSNIYVGVDNKARKVKAVYVGVNGIARQCWPAGILPNSYTQFEYIDGRCGLIYADVNPLSYPRIVVDLSVLDNHTYGGAFIEADYDYNNYNPDTGEGWQTTWRVTYEAAFFLTSYMGNSFHFMYAAEQLEQSGYYPDNYDYYYSFDSNSSEGVLKNTRYKVDFFNGGKSVYLYNSEGYYSTASHNLIGDMSSKASITNQYGSPYTRYLNSIKLFGNDGVFYGAKFYNGSTLIRDYYPCYRNSDHAMGYYDLVDKIFYPCKYGSWDSQTNCSYETAVNNGYYIGPIV